MTLLTYLLTPVESIVVNLSMVLSSFIYLFISFIYLRILTKQLYVDAKDILRTKNFHLWQFTKPFLWSFLILIVTAFVEAPSSKFLLGPVRKIEPSPVVA